MKIHLQTFALRATVATLLAGHPLFAADNFGQLQRSFNQPPDDARIMVRWWWFGTAVTKPEIERELTTMKAGGIGGVEVQQTYPLQLDGELSGVQKNNFLSPEHRE